MPPMLPFPSVSCGHDKNFARHLQFGILGAVWMGRKTGLRQVENKNQKTKTIMSLHTPDLT
jgi:hypothetical protein